MAEMKTVDYAEALADFENLVERAANGEPFVISRDGKPLVIVEALPSRFGGMEGEFSIPDDFDEIGRDEIETMFYGQKA